MLRTLLLRFICHREIVLVLISADVALLRTSTPKPLRENEMETILVLSWWNNNKCLHLKPYSTQHKSSQKKRAQFLFTHPVTDMLRCCFVYRQVPKIFLCHNFACELVQQTLEVWTYSKPDLHFFEGINIFFLWDQSWVWDMKLIDFYLDFNT